MLEYICFDNHAPGKTYIKNGILSWNFESHLSGHPDFRHQEFSSLKILSSHQLVTAIFLFQPYLQVITSFIKMMFSDKKILLICNIWLKGFDFLQ